MGRADEVVVVVEVAVVVVLEPVVVVVMVDSSDPAGMGATSSELNHSRRIRLGVTSAIHRRSLKGTIVWTDPL